MRLFFNAGLTQCAFKRLFHITYYRMFAKCYRSGIDRVY